MPIPLCFIPDDRPDLHQVRRPGACWWEPAWLDGADAIAPRYMRRWGGVRPPLVVLLPEGTCFCLDLRERNDKGWYGEGWVVDGDASSGEAFARTVTVTPSIHINAPGGWHGWCTRGSLTGPGC